MSRRAQRRAGEPSGGGGVGVVDEDAIATVPGEGAAAHVAESPLRAPVSWQYSLIAAAGLALAIQVGSLFLPTYIMPSWPEIIAAVPSIRPMDVVATTLRVVLALLVSFVLGAGAALAAHRVMAVERYLLPLVRLLMAIPVVAWIIITILWFRGIELRVAFVLAVVCGPVFMLDLLDAMKSIPKGLRDMLRSFRPTTAQYYLKLMLPGVLPAIFTSWKVNISLSVRVATIAELVGAVSGMGYVFTLARNLFNMPLVFASTIVLVLQLFLLQGVVLWLERRALRWRD